LHGVKLKLGNLKAGYKKKAFGVYFN
jgi:hypothetical protein